VKRLLRAIWKWLFGRSDVPRQPRWEAVPAFGNASDGARCGYVIGYQVRWSEPDECGRYLWVGHYFAGPDASLTWCELAAVRHAARFNAQRRAPWEFRH
jgi:hypothetical protein